MPDKGWQRRFDDPIPLPKGRQLVTLEDAASIDQGAIIPDDDVSTTRHFLVWDNYFARGAEVCTGADLLAAATCGFFLAASTDEAERAKAAMARNDTNLVIVSSLRNSNNHP
jgi:hypothetical protein